MREALAYATSACFHVILLALLARTWDQPPELLSLDTGRASLQLTASTGLPGPQMEVVIEAQAPIETRLSEVTEMIVTREETSAETLPTAEPVVELTDPIEETVVEPLALARREVTEEDELPLAAPQSPQLRRSLRPAPQSGGHEGDDIAPPALASSASAGADTETLPIRAANPAPQYPPESLVAMEQGVVILRALVGSRGAVESVQVERSSGYPALDGSALRTVRLWRFTPGRRGGVPASFEVLIPVRFSIRSG